MCKPNVIAASGEVMSLSQKPQGVIWLRAGRDTRQEPTCTQRDEKCGQGCHDRPEAEREQEETPVLAGRADPERMDVCPGSKPEGSERDSQCDVQ